MKFIVGKFVMKKIFTIAGVLVFIFYNSATFANNKSAVIDVSTVHLDANQMLNMPILVSGVFMNFGDENGFLYQSWDNSMVSLMVNAEGADRATREYLLRNCGTGCDVTLSGVLRKNILDILELELRTRKVIDKKSLFGAGK